MIASEDESRTARVAVVLRPEQARCQVSFGADTAFVQYAVPFAPRAESLTPGHLVAVSDSPGSDALILWRWYDAVVLEQSTTEVLLWEPAHGEVLAQARNPQHAFPPGTRAYASAGLQGADWWVEGPVVAVEQARVALDEVLAFYTEHDLWGRLT